MVADDLERLVGQRNAFFSCEYIPLYLNTSGISFCISETEAESTRRKHSSALGLIARIVIAVCVFAGIVIGGLYLLSRPGTSPNSSTTPSSSSSSSSPSNAGKQGGTQTTTTSTTTTTSSSQTSTPCACVTPEFPFGTMASVVVPMIALVAFALFGLRKSVQKLV